MKHKPQKGFSLVTAIFLLVVLGGLGTMMVTFFAAQQQSSALDVVGSRAYQAARAGIELGAYQVLQPGASCASVTASLPAGTLAGTLNGFTVTIGCTAFANTEDGVPVTLYQLISNASQGVDGQPDRVERQIQATVVGQ